MRLRLIFVTFYSVLATTCKAQAGPASNYAIVSPAFDYTFTSIEALADVAAGGDHIANTKDTDFTVGLQNADFMDAEIKKAQEDLSAFGVPSDRVINHSYEDMNDAFAALDKAYVDQSALYVRLLDDSENATHSRGILIHELDNLNPQIAQDWKNLTYAAKIIPSIWCCQPQANVFGPLVLKSWFTTGERSRLIAQVKTSFSAWVTAPSSYYMPEYQQPANLFWSVLNDPRYQYAK